MGHLDSGFFRKALRYMSALMLPSGHLLMFKTAYGHTVSELGGLYDAYYALLPSYVLFYHSDERAF